MTKIARRGSATTTAAAAAAQLESEFEIEELDYEMPKEVEYYKYQVM